MKALIPILYFCLVAGFGSVSAQLQLPDCPTAATANWRSCKFVSKYNRQGLSTNRGYWLAADSSGTLVGLVTYGAAGPKYLGQLASSRFNNYYDSFVPNGIGGMYYPNGSVVEGRWKDGFFQENSSIPLSFLAQYIETVNQLNASVWMPDALEKKASAGGSQNSVVGQSRATANSASASTALSSEYIFCPSTKRYYFGDKNLCPEHALVDFPIGGNIAALDVSVSSSTVQNSQQKAILSQLEDERKKLAEERSKIEAEKVSIQQAKAASRLAIKGSATQPDANGDFTITIQTNADTASLKIDGEELGGKRDGNYVIKRVARVGEDNSYKITARDVFGNTDSATVTVSRQVADSRPAIPKLNPANVRVQQSRDAVAIIIGIENYRRVAKADFANADAKEFYTYASRALGIKPANIKLLVDDGADLSDVLDAFQNWLPLKVNKGKTDVYVFYSGHGYPSQDGKSLYFLPFNVDKQYLDRTSVKQKEIVTALQKAQAKSVTMFIDACYSGQTRNGEVLVAGIKPVSITTEEQAYPPEFTVITASAADQFSSASQDLKHGIFSFYLMKALEGDADGNNDGRLTSGELQRYLSDMVGRQAMGLNRIQNTQLFGNADRVLMTR
jgi:hypothetical protein